MITINEPGARTLKDVRPMRINGLGVYVTQATETAYLIVGGSVVADRKTADRLTIAEAQRWAVEYRDETNAWAEAQQAAAWDHMAL